ncbi:MAG: hypothetical protein K6F67_07135 [Oscillospiraceae bacterium]|nr:hypothetical protein [Oscillospiraceae bacterium]
MNEPKRSIGKRLPYYIGYGLCLAGFIIYFMTFKVWIFAVAALLLFGATIYLFVLQKLEKSAMASYMPYMLDRGDHDPLRPGRFRDPYGITGRDDDGDDE